MSHAPLRPLRSAAALALTLTALLAGCEKDNPGFCGNDCPVDADVTDAREGCVANPDLCTIDEDCLDNVCVDCTAANDHQSTECTDPAAPICGTNRDCRACAADSECDTDLCDHGVCAPPTSVLFVEFTAGDDGAGNPCINKATPCKTVSHAVSEVPTTAGTPDTNRRYIKLMTTGTYTEPGLVTIDDKTVVIVGAPLAGGDRSILDRNGNGATMEIKGGADVRLERLAVSNGVNSASADGIICNNAATLVADDILVDGNVGTGIVSDGCTLTLRNSLISFNREGGVSVLGPGRAVIVNNVITDNGGAATSSFGGLRIDVGVDPSSVVQSNTVANNDAIAVDGITCMIAGITAVNNIVFGDALKARVAGPCTFDHTVYGPDDPGAVLGTARGNMLVANQASLMFQDPGDYHIKPGSAAKGVGTITGLAAEAMKDLDGQPRPQGAPDVGADEIPD